MDLLHAILFAILQGATELFPVSSLGHAVIVPRLLHWRINQASPAFLPFLVMLHLGTAIGLLIYFWRDWFAMLEGLLGRGYAVENTTQRGLLLRLIVATLPAVIIGVIVKKPVAHLFANPLAACIFLILNGGLLWLGERLRAQGSRSFGKTAATLSYMDALVIGLFQCLAFLPGISRSGAAIVGGLRRGVAHEPAAKFTFLMGTPVIFAASVLEIPKLLHQHELHALFGTSLIAAVVAGIVAWASTAFLMRYFRDHDSWALLPFAWYCALGGALAFVAIIVGL
jgi:undecaprenyl-diphosphatase